MLPGKNIYSPSVSSPEPTQHAVSTLFNLLKGNKKCNEPEQNLRVLNIVGMEEATPGTGHLVTWPLPAFTEAASWLYVDQISHY